MPPLGMDWGLPRQEPIRASVRSNDAMLQSECAACQEQYYSMSCLSVLANHVAYTVDRGTATVISK